MDEPFCYLNTDLDLTSADDLTALAAAFQTEGLISLQLARGEDGQWYASFERSGLEDQPEETISALLAVVESLGESLRSVWFGCTLREFNIGYDCGSKPWAFNQGLSSHLLGRMRGSRVAANNAVPAGAREAAQQNAVNAPMDVKP